MRLIFQHPKFRRLWISSAFNDLGLITYFMVLGWLTLDITDSPFWVGASMGMNGLGLVFFGMAGGVLADRLERRTLVAGSLLLQAAMVFALAALILFDWVQLWHILTLAFLDGVAVSVKLPARLALTLDVVGRDRLLSATAANFSALTVMGIVAPLLTGLVVTAFDVGWAYLIAGGAFLMSAAVVLRLGSTPRRQRPPASPWHDLKQGVSYVFGTRVIRTLIVMALIGETFGWAHESMLPVMARDVLEVGVSGLGYMLAVASAGATVSTVVVSNIGDFKEKGKLMLVGAGGFGLFLMLFAASRSFPLSMALLAMAYAMVMAYEATLTTILQTTVPDEMRGRVLSFQTLIWGLAGTAGFHTGAIASAVGAPLAIAIGGGVVLLNALRLVRRAPRLGVLAAEGEGVDTASTHS